jgi:hypothetical protein
VLGILPLIPMIATLFGYGAVILLAWHTIRTGSIPLDVVRQPAPAQQAS